MKMDDYKRTLNDIKCSDEFRAKMEKLLSQPPESIDVSEYEDSVSAVEIVHTKRKWTHFAAVAAAAVIVVGGVGGGTYYHFSNIPEADTGIEQSTAEEILKAETSETETETDDSPFSGITQMHMTINFKNAMSTFDADDLPDSVTENIKDYFGKLEWTDITQNVSDEDILEDESDSITLVCTKDKGSFTLTAYESGLVDVAYEDGSPNVRFLDEYLYSDIANIAGAGLFEADLSSYELRAETTGIEHSLSKEKASEVTAVFNNYSSQLEKYNEEEHKTNDYIKFSVSGFYSITIDCDGYADIYFNGQNGISLSASYRVPVEMYTELIATTQKVYESDVPDVPWAETGWDSLATASVYRYGSYHTYFLGDTGQIVSAIEGLDWKQTASGKDINYSSDRIELYIGGVLSFYPDGEAAFEGYSTDASAETYYYDLGKDTYDSLLSLFEQQYEDDYSADTNFKAVVQERITDGTDTLLYVNYTRKDEDASTEIRTDFTSSDEFCEVINNCQWEAVDFDEYIGSVLYENFTVEGLHFTKDGLVYDEYYSNIFRLVTGDPSNYLAIFEKNIAADPDNYDAYRDTVGEADIVSETEATTW